MLGRAFSHAPGGPRPWQRARACVLVLPSAVRGSPRDAKNPGRLETGPLASHCPACKDLSLGAGLEARSESSALNAAPNSVMATSGSPAW